MAETLVLDLILLFLALTVAIACVMMRNLLASAAMLAIYSLLMSLVWTNMYALDVAFTEAAVGAGISTILLVGALVITGTREKVERPIHWPALVLVLLVGAVLGYGTIQLPAFGDPDAPIHNYVYEGYVNQDVGKPKPQEMGAPGQWDQFPDPQQWRERRKLFDQLDVETFQTDHPQSGHGDNGTGEADDHEDHEDHGDFSHHSPNLVTAVLASYRGFDTMFETAVIFTAGISVILLLRRRETVPPPSENRTGSGSGDGDGDGDDRSGGSADSGSGTGDAARQEVGP